MSGVDILLLDGHHTFFSMIGMKIQRVFKPYQYKTYLEVQTAIDNIVTAVGWGNLTTEQQEAVARWNLVTDQPTLDALMAADEQAEVVDFYNRSTRKESSLFIDDVTAVLKSDVDGIVYDYLGLQTTEVHISKGGQHQYSTIKAALETHNGPNYVFIVHPGVYVEDNPLVVPNQTVLISHGHAENTFIVAANPAEHIVNVGYGVKMNGFAVTGANSSGGVGIYYNGSQSGGLGKYSSITETFVINCDVGVEVDGQNLAFGVTDTLYMREIIIAATTTQLSKGVYCHSKGHFISTSVAIAGVPATPLPSPAIPIVNAFDCQGTDSKLAMTASNSFYCSNGLYMDDSSICEVQLLTIRGAQTGLIIGPNGTETRVSINSLEIGDAALYDVDIQCLQVQFELHSGVLNETKINNPNGVKLNARFNSHKNGKTYQGLLGDVHIGVVNEPSKVHMGEGNYDVGTITYLTNDNLEAGTWVDVTPEANSFDNSTFDLFSGTTAGNCLYIGRDAVPVGFKTEITTATLANTAFKDIVWEYWDGSVWTEFHVMQTGSEAPHSFISDNFVSSTGKKHVRFGLRSDSALVNKTLNTFNHKWVRARVVNALSSVPQAEYIKSHTNSFKVNTDGYNEYYGDARPVKKLDWEVRSTYAANSVPGDQDLYISKALGVSMTNNEFPDSTLTRIGLTTYTPRDIDTSFPIKVIISFVCDITIAGDVEFVVRYDAIVDGDNVYHSSASAPTNTTNEKTASVIKSVTTANVLYSTCVALQVDELKPAAIGGMLGMLWFAIERDAQVGNANDTYAGNVSIVQIYPFYTTWNDGGHLLGL